MDPPVSRKSEFIYSINMTPQKYLLVNTVGLPEKSIVQEMGTHSDGRIQVRVLHSNSSDLIGRRVVVPKHRLELLDTHVTFCFAFGFIMLLSNVRLSFLWMLIVVF